MFLSVLAFMKVVFLQELFNGSTLTTYSSEHKFVTKEESEIDCDHLSFLSHELSKVAYGKIGEKGRKGKYKITRPQAEWERPPQPQRLRVLIGTKYVDISFTRESLEANNKISKNKLCMEHAVNIPFTTSVSFIFILA
jgi:hypothetical protein